MQQEKFNENNCKMVIPHEDQESEIISFAQEIQSNGDGDFKKGYESYRASISNDLSALNL